MKKDDLMTFKVDEELAEVLRTIPNRSDFIRKAVLNAIHNTCPLCRGSGTLTPAQKKHWDAFSAHHSIVICDECSEPYITCDREPVKGKR